MWRTLVIVVFINLVIAQASAGQEQDTLLVETDQGPVRGFKDADGDIFTFLNIPYATAPSGNNKFKAPLPGPVWTQVFEAVDRGIMCPQIMQTTQDDCLVANVVVPADTSVSNLPVMVYVHGGGYIIGAGSSIQYYSLVKTQRVIVVTFNYRLGVHGFLCLGTEDVPGNAGMKDQVALLRWVNRNIANFGGNPLDVTIAGCSAGGGSVDLLTLSPMTTGLFHKVITESSSSIGFTGLQMDPIEYAKTYARELQFDNVDDLGALEVFYKTASNELWISGTDHMLNNSAVLFTPCLERDTGTGEEMFMSETPWNLLKSGQYPNLPLLYGYANMEGLFSIDSFDVQRDDMDANFSRYLPVDLQFENDEQREEVAKVVKDFYFGDRGVTQDTVLDYVDYYTDILFASCMLRGLTLRRNANNDTVYLYEYAFTDENTASVPYTEVRGADHCTQAYAVMDEDTSSATPEYLHMKAVMRELWLNFIIAGSPVPEGSSLPAWPPVETGWTPHMALNTVSSISPTLAVNERAVFWEGIYERHNRQPVPPSGPPGSASADTSVCSILLLIGVLIIKIV